MKYASDLKYKGDWKEGLFYGEGILIDKLEQCQ